MKKNNSSRKNKLLAILLSALMGSSVVALSACNGDTSTDSSNSSSSSASSVEEVEETEEEKSYLIQNPDFSTVSDANLKYFSTTTSSWTRAANNPSTGTAQSSKAASGIIDTSDKAWDSMTTNNKDGIDATKLTEAQAKEKWSKLTLKDKLAYYKTWEDSNKDDNKKLANLDFYEAVTIDEEDLPKATTKNPRTWDYSTTEAAKTDYDSHVLMIHNDYDTTSNRKQGTAQKYTSSSTVTVAAGTAMELSLWVKTAELRSATTDNAEAGQEPVDKGAYIRITHSVGNQQLEPLEVKNINTELMGVTDNNGWKQYTFYLNGSSFSDTTFTLVLGLGQGGGDDVNEYVNGYAFFDDIQCKPISDFNTKTETIETFTLADNEVGQKTVNVFNDSCDKFALDFSGSTFVASDYLKDETKFSFSYTTEENKTDGVFTAVNGAASGILKAENAKKPTSLGTAIDGTNDVAKVFANPADMASGNRYLQAVYNNYLLGKDATESKFYQSLGENGKATLMLLSAEGAAITAENAQKISLKQGEYLAFSFFVKTSAASGTAGATVTLKDAKGNALASIASIDSTTATPITIGDDKDAYDGWQQCFFFISAEKDTELTLTFQLGPTTVIGTTQDAYKSGFAAFAGFKTYDFTDKTDPTNPVILEEEFDLAAEGTYAKIVTVKDTDNENTDSFDSVAAVSPEGKTIETGYANPKNYKLYTGSTKKIVKSDETENPITTAGLLNQQYAEAYNSAGILTALGATTVKEDGVTETTATERWNEVFGGGLLGTANQPLVIYNSQYKNRSYGFVGTTKTVAANNYAAISMRVKVSAGAKAYVYLIDTTDDSFNKKLSVSGSVIYWYDDDGNVCAGDPSAKDIQNKIAFMREENGLYTVNEAWWNTVSTAPVPTGYYANLQAYGEPKNGNLLLAEGFNPYNYTDQWQHEGNDGIAFYDYTETTENGKVTRKAYDSKKTEKNLVEDFENLLSTLTLEKDKSPVRFKAEAARELYFEIDGDTAAGEWSDVTFFVKAGEQAKNYRVEIWIGSRDNTKTAEPPATAYVIADSRNVGTLDETLYNNNLTARKDDATDKFESVFSFFDTAKFLRYNKDLDVNKVGNSYDNYLQSEKAEGIAYLTYQQDNTFETYVDFTLSDVPVATDPVEDEEDETEDATTDSEVNVWLLASSIAIAAVLVLAVISLIIRKAFKSARKKHTQATSNKNNKK